MPGHMEQFQSKSAPFYQYKCQNLKKNYEAIENRHAVYTGICVSNHIGLAIPIDLLVSTTY